ncbi:hypothetical protein GCM10023405_12790 [Streptomonospora salina]
MKTTRPRGRCAGSQASADRPRSQWRSRGSAGGTGSGGAPEPGGPWRGPTGDVRCRGHSPTPESNTSSMQRTLMDGGRVAPPAVRCIVHERPRPGAGLRVRALAAHPPARRTRPLAPIG